MRTSELTGAALDWAVAKCEGETPSDAFAIYSTWRPGNYSSDWAHGGPIIEREGIYLWRPYGVNGIWSAKLDSWPAERVIHDDKPLIAAMRCYVASKLGDEVEIPEELK